MGIQIKHREENMIEAIGMVTVLAGMGIYFIKSTDLPKDLKERSARLEQESRRSPLVITKKYSFEKIISKNQVTEAKNSAEAQLLEKKLERKKLVEIQIKRIDELTLTITKLEQELKINNERKLEIEAKIDLHLNELMILKQTKIS